MNEPHTSLAVLEQIARGGMPGQFYKALTCPGDIITVVDELHYFDVAKNVNNYIYLYGELSITGQPVDWNVSRNRVATDSMVITNITGLITYTQGVDYDVTELGKVTKKSGGSIEDKETLRMSYQWLRPCVDLKTGVPNPNCTICHGDGVIYDEAKPVMGLFHIPTYDDSLVQAGVWRVGDATYTTTSQVDVTTRFVGDNFWGKDKIIIQKITGSLYDPVTRQQDWYIVSSPSTIQINSTYLATKLHLRMRHETPDR